MKKWIVMLAVLVMFCLVGCGEKPMTAVYFQADDNSWYFADLDTDTIFSERYRISLRMKTERS